MRCVLLISITKIEWKQIEHSIVCNITCTRNVCTCHVHVQIPAIIYRVIHALYLCTHVHVHAYWLFSTLVIHTELRGIPIWI